LISLSAAILHDPKVIVVDEPMVGLDPAGVKMVKGLFRDLAQKGTTLILPFCLIASSLSALIVMIAAVALPAGRIRSVFVIS
jgi:ABC-type uncharacterized transport system ATPase subunit